MSRNEYVETVKPVKRTAEKIFGWLAWLMLLAATIALLYLLLVQGNTEGFKQNLQDVFTQAINDPKNAEVKAQLDQAGISVSELIPMITQVLWGFVIYMIVPLIFGLLGLFTMKKRILSGILLLIAGLLTTPLFFTFVLALVPLFFFIAAILMFARKNKVIQSQNYYEPKQSHTYDNNRHAAPYVDRDDNIERSRYQEDTNHVTRENTVNDETRRSSEYVYDADHKSPSNYDYHDHERETVYESKNGFEHDYNESQDHKKDINAMDERRENYNNRMNNKDQ